MHTLIWIASGLAAGVMARIVTRGRARGLLADTVLGSLGGVTGAWLLRLAYGEVPAGGTAHIATAFLGAVTWRHLSFGSIDDRP